MIVAIYSRMDVDGPSRSTYLAKRPAKSPAHGLGLHVPGRPSPPPAAPVVTFAAMTDRYLREKEAAKKKTIKADKNIIARLLVAFGSHTPLTEITAPNDRGVSAGAADDRVAEDREAARARLREP